MESQWPLELDQWLSAVPDCRRVSKYSRKSLLKEGLLLFMLRMGSRNRMQQELLGSHLRQGLNQWLGSCWNRDAHTDTVNRYLCSLKMQDLEQVKTQMIRKLLRSKRIGTFQGYYRLLVDGVSCASYRKDDTGCMAHKTFGKSTVYLDNLLEAKLLTEKGWIFSMLTESIEGAGRKE